MSSKQGLTGNAILQTFEEREQGAFKPSSAGRARVFLQLHLRHLFTGECGEQRLIHSDREAEIRSGF
jgi:hypothetical protein